MNKLLGIDRPKNKKKTKADIEVDESKDSATDALGLPQSNELDEEKIPEVFPFDMSARFDSTESSSRLVYSSQVTGDVDADYTDIVEIAEAPVQHADTQNRTIIFNALRTVSELCGEQAEDALLCKYLYLMTQNEIANIIGCTQAKVSKILAEAETIFRDSIKTVGIFDAIIPREDINPEV
jgi:RNA polymerase sigma factor (sigma-70 family)